MNDTTDPRPLGDDQLAEALGDALRATSDDLVIPPPVTHIADRAAARARARATRRTVGSVAASVMLVAGGVLALNNAGGGDPDRQDVAIESGDPDDPAANPPDGSADEAPEAAFLGDDPAFSSSRGQTGPSISVDPAEYSTGASLQWTEVDGPTQGGGNLWTLPDGRVMARLWPVASGADVVGAEAVFVTSDGTTWEPVAMPPGVSPALVDLGERLWVVTGWDDDGSDDGEAVFVSRDEGASWQRVVIPESGESGDDSYLVTRSHVGAAAVLGDRLVVAVSSFVELDYVRIALEQGLADSADEVVGFGYTTDDASIVSLSIDVSTGFVGEGGERVPSDVESHVLDPAEIGLPADVAALLESERQGFTLLSGDADGLQPVVDFTGNAWRMLSADGTLILVGVDDEGSAVWTSTDTEAWTRIDAGEGFDPGGVFQGALWGGGWSSEGFVIQRLDDGLLEQVGSFPGLSLESMLSVGPSGMAATVTAGHGIGFEEDPPPPDVEDGDVSADEAAAINPVGLIAAKDGIELRFEEDGTGVLIDTTTGEVLREFSEAEVAGTELPAGVVEIEEPTFSLRIEDPETGEELVTFTEDDYAEGFGPSPGDTSSGVGVTVEGGTEVVRAEGDDVEGSEGSDVLFTPESWLAWSADGIDWSFVPVADAFGLDHGEGAWTQLAVGDGYVIATVEVFADPALAETTEGDVTPTTRWFIAPTG